MSRNRERHATGTGDEKVGVYYEQPGRAEGLARLYDAGTPLGTFYRDRLKRIAGLLDGLDGAVLDAGCGTGQMIRFLHATRPDRFVFTGLDRSATMIEVAGQIVDRDANAQSVVARIEEMPFPDETFDVVLAMGSLEYVADLGQALAEIRRVLRSGGGRWLRWAIRGVPTGCGTRSSGRACAAVAAYRRARSCVVSANGSSGLR
jgi:ubiquinone/menaquinone biosynthesis C-methylase UbiE